MGQIITETTFLSDEFDGGVDLTVEKRTCFLISQQAFFRHFGKEISGIKLKARVLEREQPDVNL